MTDQAGGHGCAGLLSLLGFLVIIAGDALGDALAAEYGWGHTLQTSWSIGRWPFGVILAWASFIVVLESVRRAGSGSPGTRGWRSDPVCRLRCGCC